MPFYNFKTILACWFEVEKLGGSTCVQYIASEKSMSIIIICAAHDENHLNFH